MVTAACITQVRRSYPHFTFAASRRRQMPGPASCFLGALLLRLVSWSDPWQTTCLSLGCPGARALAACEVPGSSGVVVAAGGGAQWWQEDPDSGLWRCTRSSVDPALRGPLFSIAVDPSSGSVAVGGGEGRAASLFTADGALLATLEGHTGWVRAMAFHAGQLFTVGCNFVKVWRPLPEGVGWKLVGDLVGEGDILALAISACGVLVAAGVSSKLQLWQLPSRDLRPKEWLAAAEQSLTTQPSLHEGRVTCLSSQGCWLFSVGQDGHVQKRRFLQSSAQAGDSLQSARLTALHGKFESIAILEEGDLLAVGSDAGELCVFDGRNLELLGRLQGLHQGAPVSSLCPVSGGRVASVSSRHSHLEVTPVLQIAKN
ncbi:unnamed protein product, partial [Polarella glacialis]